jgi:hypothetical protein
VWQWCGSGGSENRNSEEKPLFLGLTKLSQRGKHQERATLLTTFFSKTSSYQYFFVPLQRLLRK